MMHRFALMTHILTALLLSLTTAYSVAETIWIDVRSPAEFSVGHIDGAINIPHNKIAKTIHEKVPNKNADIKLYCRSGRRSALSLAILQDLGYSRVADFGAYRRADTELLK